MFADILSGKFRDDLCTGTYFKHIIKAGQNQCCQDDICVLDIIELAVQGRLPEVPPYIYNLLKPE